MLQHDAEDPYDPIHPNGGVVDVWLMDEKTIACDPLLVNAVIDAVDTTLPRSMESGSGQRCPAHARPPLSSRAASQTARSLVRELLNRSCNGASVRIMDRVQFSPLPGALEQIMSNLSLSNLDSINPSLTRYGRSEMAPVLPLREEPDLLSWLESSGRLVADEETASADVSTVEEEELSALMGEKEDYNPADDQSEEDWED